MVYLYITILDVVTLTSISLSILVSVMAVCQFLQNVTTTYSKIPRLLRSASILTGRSIDGIYMIASHTHDHTYIIVYVASYGLSDDQREFQKVALNFAQNEMAPYMRQWDEEVSGCG